MIIIAGNTFDVYHAHFIDINFEILHDFTFQFPLNLFIFSSESFS